MICLHTFIERVMYIYMYWLLLAAVACVDSRLLFVAEVKRCDLFAHFYRTSYVNRACIGLLLRQWRVDSRLLFVTAVKRCDLFEHLNNGLCIYTCIGCLLQLWRVSTRLLYVPVQKVAIKYHDLS